MCRPLCALIFMLPRLLLNGVKRPIPASLMSMAGHPGCGCSYNFANVSTSPFHPGQFGILKSRLLIKALCMRAGSP